MPENVLESGRETQARCANTGIACVRMCVCIVCVLRVYVLGSCAQRKLAEHVRLNGLCCVTPSSIMNCVKVMFSDVKYRRNNVIGPGMTIVFSPICKG